jgi:hypothetical protein
MEEEEMPDFRDKLNDMTLNLVNWKLPGSLFFSRHHYSNRELAERGFVILFTALGGIWLGIYKIQRKVLDWA